MIEMAHLGGYNDTLIKIIVLTLRLLLIGQIKENWSIRAKGQGKIIYRELVDYGDVNTKDI